MHPGVHRAAPGGQLGSPCPALPSPWLGPWRGEGSARASESGRPAPGDRAPLSGLSGACVTRDPTFPAPERGSASPAHPGHPQKPWGPLGRRPPPREGTNRVPHSVTAPRPAPGPQPDRTQASEDPAVLPCPPESHSRGQPPSLALASLPSDGLSPSPPRPAFRTPVCRDPGLGLVLSSLRALGPAKLSGLVTMQRRPGAPRAQGAPRCPLPCLLAPPACARPSPLPAWAPPPAPPRPRSQ